MDDANVSPQPPRCTTEDVFTERNRGLLASCEEELARIERWERRGPLGRLVAWFLSR